MFLGREVRRARTFLSDGQMEKQARETLTNLSVRTVSSVRQLVANLSGGQRQTVAIAKAVLWNSKVVFLDEPTAALGVAQTRQVLDLVKRLADQGRGVVLISHNMNDVMEVADRVAALYLGRVAAEVKTTQTDTTQIVELITSGRSGEIGLAPPPPTRASRGRHVDQHTRGRRQPGQGAKPGPRRGVSLDVEERSIPEAITGWVRKLRSGDPGALPSVLGLVVLALIFMQVSDRFLSKYNIGNLPGQGLYIAIIALGLVFVLLLGEIDLSAGTAGGTCAALAAQAVFSGNLHQALPTALYWGLVVGLAIAIAMAIWLKAWSGAAVVAVGLFLVATNLTQHLFLALVAAVCIGAAIGVLNGYLVAKVGIPSFVVTLALFLAWQGVLQFVLSGQPINT